MTIRDFDKASVSKARSLRFFLERYEAARRAKLDSFVGCQMGEAVKLPTMDDSLQVSKLAGIDLLSLQQRRIVSLLELD